PRVAPMNTTGIVCFGCGQGGHVRRDCQLQNHPRMPPATGPNRQPLQPRVQFQQQGARPVNILNKFDNPSMWQEDYYDEDQSAELYDMMMAEKRKRGPPVVSESPQEERLRKRNNITPEPAQYPLQNFPAPPKKPTPDVVMPDVVPTLVERPHYEMKVPIKERAEGFHILDKLDEIPVSIKFSELLANAPTLRKEVAQALTSHRQEKKINIASASLSNTTSLSAPVRVEGIATKAFIDTGAAVSAVSNQFQKKFGFDVTRAASYKICGIDGRKIVPLGEIDGFPL